MTWVEALVLGVIQGITEFLPISSDGHLQIAGHLFAQQRGAVLSGSESLFFNVMLHLGTLAAILLFYRRSIASGAGTLLGGEPPSPLFSRHQIIRAGLLTVIATIPAAVAGLGLKPWIEWTTEQPWIGGLGFLVTACMLTMTLWLKGGDRALAETTWRDAALIGCAQMLALLPGVSRSGMTICTALALGLSRPWAVGFSLRMAVAAITGAGIVEIKDVDLSRLSPVMLQQIIAATLVSAAVGFLAVVALDRIVRRGWLWYFSVYLVLLAGFVFWTFPPGHGAGADDRRETALDGSVRRPSVGGGARSPGADRAGVPALGRGLGGGA
jgi:undecaprenyl-diphosphatase